MPKGITGAGVETGWINKWAFQSGAFAADDVGRQAVENGFITPAMLAYVLGHTYFVSNLFGADTNDGLTWAKAFKTITKALSVAVNYDNIIIGLGVYDEGAALTITQVGLKLIGVMTSGAMWGQPSIKGLATTNTLINVKANSVEIAGIGFTQNRAAKIISIAEDAWGVDVWRTHIHHCFFGGNGIATYGVWYGGVGTDAPFTIIEDCEFYDCLEGIYSNGSSKIQRNLIEVMAAGVGIEDIPNGSSRPGCWILDNRFRSLDAVNGKGIKVTNTPASGQLLIDGNDFAGFADAAHACDVSGSGKTGLMGLNYNGITAIPIS